MSSLPIRDTVVFGAQEVCSPHLLHANRHWWGLYRKKSCFFPSYCHMLFHLPQQNVCLSEVHSSSLHFSLLVRSHVVLSSFISCLFLYCQDKHCCLFANFSQTAKSSVLSVFSTCVCGTCPWRSASQWPALCSGPPKAPVVEWFLITWELHLAFSFCSSVAPMTGAAWLFPCVLAEPSSHASSLVPAAARVPEALLWWRKNPLSRVVVPGPCSSSDNTYFMCLEKSRFGKSVLPEWSVQQQRDGLSMPQQRGREELGGCRGGDYRAAFWQPLLHCTFSLFSWASWPVNYPIQSIFFLCQSFPKASAAFQILSLGHSSTSKIC